MGRRFYTIRFRDLSTGEDLPDVLPDITASLAWANDNKTIFYVRQDPLTLRAYRVYRHVLGTDPAKDPLVFEETDVEFHLDQGADGIRIVRGAEKVAASAAAFHRYATGYDFEIVELVDGFAVVAIDDGVPVSLLSFASEGERITVMETRELR